MTQSEFKKIISNAIKAEVEANKFYSRIAKKVKDARLKKIFTDLAKEENEHKATLKAYIAKGAPKIQFAESADYKVTDELATPVLSDDLPPLDGLLLAIKDELNAMQMYTQLAKTCVDKEQKKIFMGLAAMERGHKKKLEDLYTNMAFPEVW